MEARAVLRRASSVAKERARWKRLSASDSTLVMIHLIQKENKKRKAVKEKHKEKMKVLEDLLQKQKEAIQTTRAERDTFRRLKLYALKRSGGNLDIKMEQ